MTDKDDALSIAPNVRKSAFLATKMISDRLADVAVAALNKACEGKVKCPHCDNLIPWFGDVAAMKLVFDLHYKEREEWKKEFGEALPGDWLQLTKDASAEDVRDLKRMVADWQARVARQRSQPQSDSVDDSESEHPESPEASPPQ